MTREEVKTMLPIIQAFAEGKVIQTKNGDETWITIGKEADLNIESLAEYPDCFRIKPEPKYRPFKDVDECWQEMLKHQPFGWVKYQCDFFQIIHVDDNSIGYGSACGTILHSKFEDIFKDSMFADGAPFGVKEEVWEK